jgi:hypothetical protein
VNCSLLFEYFSYVNDYSDDEREVIVMSYVLMMVYVDEIEMYNAYNYVVSLIENDIVM